MRRIASHYIYWRQFYRLHYVELNDNGVLAGIFPLEGEIAGTEFYDGILILVPIPALDAGAQENKRCHQDSYSDTSCVIPSQVREQGAFGMLPGEQLPWNVKVLQVLLKRVRLFVCCYWAAFPWQRRNSAQMTAVAMATFKDSDVSLSGGKLGI